MATLKQKLREEAEPIFVLTVLATQILHAEERLGTCEVNTCLGGK